MKKMSWLDKPITWRTSFKVGGITMLISAVAVAIEWIMFFGNPFSKPKLKVKEEPSVEEQEEE